MATEQWAESKGRRTKQWKDQPEFDNILADLDISSLRYLKQKRHKDIYEFKNGNDLNNPDTLNEYKYLQQNYKMICDEIVHREMDMKASNIPKENFDTESGLVINEDGFVVSSIDFSENEDSFIYRDSDGNITEERIIDNYEPRRKRTRKEVYQDWEYTA